MQSLPDKNIGSAKNLKVCLFIPIYVFIMKRYEPLRMKIDHLSTTLGVENDVESHCNVNSQGYIRFGLFWKYAEIGYFG